MQIERHTLGGETLAQKDRGAPPCENAPHGTTDTADSTKPFNPLRAVFAAPLAVDLLILAVAAALLIGGAA